MPTTSQWGTIAQGAGTLIKIGAKIGGSIAARKAERRYRHRQDKLLKEMTNRENANFENQYYADATATADNQRALTQMQNYLRQRRSELSGQMGMGMASEESLATQKAADNEAVAQTYSTVAANATGRKDALLDAHQSKLDDIAGTKMGLNREHLANRQTQIQNGVKIGEDTGNQLYDIGTEMGGSMPARNQKENKS